MCPRKGNPTLVCGHATLIEAFSLRPLVCRSVGPLVHEHKSKSVIMIVFDIFLWGGAWGINGG